MLLDDVTIEQLAEHLALAMDAPTWPGLHREADRERIARRAQAVGLWDALADSARPQPIEVLSRSVFRQYRREGIREPYQQLHDQRLSRTIAAGYAVWLEHPAAELDYVQDLFWAWCEATTWLIPAHEWSTSGLELGSTRVGRVLAELAYLLRGRLEDEVYDRLVAEVDRRMLDAACDWRRPNTWATRPMNWNHVCNANLIQVALYRIDDPFTLAHFIHPLIQRLDYALNGFAGDGGCLEGPGYWAYGFGHFVQAAIAVHQRTAGRVNLMADERVAPICRYPLAVHFAGKHRVTVADAADGYVDADVAAAINHLHALPDLCALTCPREDGRLDVRDWRTLGIYDGQPVPRELTHRDWHLPETGLARLIAADDPATQFAITVGHNGVPHNHNDVGSFIYYRHGRAVLVDPGAPRYTARTFGPDRYELVHCRTLGHSLPVIDGQEQAKGGEHGGQLRIEPVDTDGTKRVAAEIAQAYPLPALRSLTRTLTLTPDGSLEIVDTFELGAAPASLDEGFVTFDDVTVSDDGRSARLSAGDDEAIVTLRAADDTPGTFAVHALSESVDQGRDGRLLRRVTFTPAELATRMTVRFTVA